MTDTSSSSAITPAAIDRLEGQASRQLEADSTQLALTPYEYGTAPGGITPSRNPTAQDQHPSTRRLEASQWDGKTSLLNHAQAAAPGSEVWVTVPVDKVTTSSAGASAATPVYASAKGYVPRPGESKGSIPPGPSVGRPY